MAVYYWAIGFLISFVMIVVGYIWKYSPPEKINDTYGYRTARSMQSQQSWNAAQQICAKALRVTGIILAAGALACKLLTLRLSVMSDDIFCLIQTGVSIAAMIGTIPYVEVKLKKQFENSEENSRGNRK